jgi:hypothetical protein
MKSPVKFPEFKGPAPGLNGIASPICGTAEAAGRDDLERTRRFPALPGTRMFAGGRDVPVDRAGRSALVPGRRRTQTRPRAPDRWLIGS